MIILNKKRLIFINFTILCAICYFGIRNDFNSNLELSSKQNNSTSSIQSVSSTPISNHTIILDAGHGNPDRWSSWCGWFNRS